MNVNITLLQQLIVSCNHRRCRSTWWVWWAKTVTSKQATQKKKGGLRRKQDPARKDPRNANIRWKSEGSPYTHLLAVANKEDGDVVQHQSPRRGCYQGRPLCTQPGASSRHKSRRHWRMHTAGRYLVACIIAIINEVWLKTLYNRGTDPQLSFSLVEYGVIRRRHRRILKNYLHLHRHLHRRILGRNLVLHAQSHRETFSRNPHIYQTYMQKFRSLLRYQPNHIFNPYPAFRHHRILPRVPPWIPHLTEWSGPSLD